jgi:RNA polymerase sigma-70 factor (ECF subfamily)
VARLLVKGLRVLARVTGVTIHREAMNGQPAAQFRDRDGRLIAVAVLDIAEGQIQGVSAIANPDKLRHLGPVSDVRALLRQRG